jgi:phosphoadenosine phosphosulfate reductase
MNIAFRHGYESLRKAVSGLSIEDTLVFLDKEYASATTFSTSFSNEDQVITDFIATKHPGVSIFTLDTGRLFKETYTTWASTNEYYGISIEAYFPPQGLLEQYLKEKGPNGFYQSQDNRKACCGIRKVVPLQRALKEKAVWITGLRSEHSPDRQNLEEWEWDEQNQVIKYNPLLHWTTEQVTRYIRSKRIPYNVLHDKGFVSIGCEPCTRAIKPGEAFRAGRWWWEDAGKKECGLHVKA